MEEHYIFETLLNKNHHVELVLELWKQHKLGRLLTTKIIEMSDDINVNNKNEVIEVITLFINMYRYHETKEDTIIFQEFKNILSIEKYREIGEIIREKELEILGKMG